MTKKSKVDNAEETSPPEEHPSSSEAVAENPAQNSEGEEHIDNHQKLINKARTFLASPQVRNEDIPAKRTFLSDKGLTDAEIDQLIRELPQQVPTVPPRTYPQPPPSNLPNLLVGVFRILTWITGGSAVLLLVYFKYMLPQITRSFQARSALQSHHRDLLNKLNTSLISFKSIQKESFATLPTPSLPVLRSDSEFAQCMTVDDLKSRFDAEKKTIPPFTILRCVLSSTSDKQTTETIFKSIEQHFPHLNLSQNAEFQEQLWQTLSTTPLFHEDTSTSADTPTWTYVPPSPPSPTQYLASLTSLKSALPHKSSSTQSPDTPQRSSSRFHHTLQAMTDLTGYLTTETYQLPFSFRGLNGSGIGTGRNGGSSSAPLVNPQHEELRKEIRALKGLVLNRRTFNIPRIPSGNASSGTQQLANASASTE